jgi:hypothetical protein
MRFYNRQHRHILRHPGWKPELETKTALTRNAMIRRSCLAVTRVS